MAYQLPLKFIRASQDVAFCATRIVAIMSADSFPCRKLLQSERKSGTLLNACGKEGAKTAIILDNGTVIASPYTINRIVRQIATADAKNHTPRRLMRNRGDVDADDIEENGIFDEATEEENALMEEDANRLQEDDTEDIPDPLADWDEGG